MLLSPQYISVKLLAVSNVYSRYAQIHMGHQLVTERDLYDGEITFSIESAAVALENALSLS